MEFRSARQRKPRPGILRPSIRASRWRLVHVQALRFLGETDGSRAFNLGTGRPISVRQVIAAVERVLGTKVPTIEAPRRPGDPPRLFAAPGLAGRDLGWLATRSDIDRIVDSAAGWRRWA